MIQDLDPEITAFLGIFTKDPVIKSFLKLSVGRVLLRLKNRRQNWRDIALNSDIKELVDWLEVSVHCNEAWLHNLDDLGRPKKLMKFGDLDGIYKEARDYLIKKAQTNPTRKIVQGDEELVSVLNDGYYVVKLLTPEALDNESKQMQHCVGLGTYDKRLLRGEVVIYSLRDRFNRPHVTVEYDVGSSAVAQVRGKQNADPKNTYMKLVREFILGVHPTDIYRSSSIGLILDQWGDYHPVDQMPDGLCIRHSLDLSSFGLESLPRDMDIGGDLVIARTSIKYLPPGLKVRGALKANKSDLTEIRKDHGISGSIDIAETNVTVLPDNLYVGGDLTLDDTAISHLPKELTVVGNLSLKNTKIENLPSCLVVGRNLDISGSQVTHLGKTKFYVGGDLFARDCRGLVLPDVISVEMVADLSGSTFRKNVCSIETGEKLLRDHTFFEVEPQVKKVKSSIERYIPVRRF